MFSVEEYSIAAFLLPRFLGLIYLAAFAAFYFQMQGLFCSNGILPIADYLRAVKKYHPGNYYRLIPSIFWINSTDAVLKGSTLVGILLSLFLICGIYPSLLLFLLYILYLSIVSTGQDFLSFGWEGFFLEITVNTFFLSLTSPADLMVWISVNVLLFRFFFQAGIVKLQSGDPNWKNLTALAYHYQSQPIPNMVAWYVHKFPLWFHKFSTGVMFLIELVTPFFIFGSEPVRLCVFFAFVGLQMGIWMTGNFSYLNHLTALFSIILVGNAYLVTWISIPISSNSGLALQLLCTIAGTLLLLLQFMQLASSFLYIPLITKCLQKISPFHIINRYGIFAVMTTKRNEIVFEGSDDEINWKEYLFFHKPSEINRRPRRVSPYQPRIDWQAWFLPLGNYRYDVWYENFIYHLLKGTPEVLSLIRKNPFSEHAPRFVRSLIYEYEFSSIQEKKQSGCWWRRKYIGVFTPTITLKNSTKK
jgi:lipase maturation factor 1